MPSAGSSSTAITRSPLIVPLDTAAARDRSLCGGKAAVLAELLAAGFPVPPGVVVASPVLGRVLDELEIARPLRELLVAGPAELDAIESAAAPLQRRLERARLPADVAASLDAVLAALQENAGEAPLFAVRSSGVAEDLEQASLAGQYETILGVTRAGVAAAVVRCWASFASGRSLHYRRARGITELRGAVLVQRLIRADAAGVAFTADPLTGVGDAVLIDSGHGLGDAVVAGRVTPDAFVVAKQDLALRSSRLAGRPSLSDEQAQAVARLALRVEQARGAAVDVEWARRGEELHLLQARPITAAAARLPPPGWAPDLDTPIDPRFPVYSNGNVGEVMPGCLTPLSWSNLAAGLEHAFRNTQESLGTMRDVGPRYVVVGYFFHRLYLNVSYFVAATDNAPGGDRRTAVEEVAGADEQLELPPPPAAWRRFLPWEIVRGLRILARVIEMQRTLPGAIERATEATREQCDLLGDGRFESAPLEASFQVQPERELLPGLVHVRASMLAQIAFAHLRKLSARWLGDADGSLARALVAGIGDLAGAAPALALSELAELVRQEPQLLALCAAEPDDQRLHERLARLGSPAAERFRERLASFLARFGHRGYGEGELRNARWRERPAEVLALLRPALAPGAITATQGRARQEAAAEAARQDAARRLTGWRRGQFLSALATARANIASRERTKDLIAALLDVARVRYLAASRRLVAAGRLAAEDDVFFLLREELERIAKGERARAEVQALVARRRRDFEWSCLVSVPKLQQGRALFSASVAPPLAAGRRLLGIAASPGRVAGPARVVLDPRDPAGLQPGEVLVVPVTDLAWTPLFLSAAALVVEVGGLLSHGSIVAREYGIPAVVAVADATRLIRDGDRIAVDGDQGVVVIEGVSA